eukprot:6150209-Prymnesium_polylepis.1
MVALSTFTRCPAEYANRRDLLAATAPRGVEQASGAPAPSRPLAHLGAQDLLGGGAPAGGGAEHVGQLLLLGHGDATVEARVDLLPLQPVDLDEGGRRHRAVEVLRAEADLVGRVLLARRVLGDELRADGDVLRPLAQ